MLCYLQVLSVAVYNHYKRIFNNTPTPSNVSNQRQDMAIMEQGPHHNFTHRGRFLNNIVLYYSCLLNWYRVS